MISSFAAFLCLRRKNRVAALAAHREPQLMSTLRTENSRQNQLTRRSFLQALGAGTAALAIPSASASAIPANAKKAASENGKQITLFHDGAFTGDAWGWQFTEGATIAAEGRTPAHNSVQIHSRNGDYARFLVLAPEVGKSYTISGWVRTENIVANNDECGAFFAANQYEFQGRSTEFTVDGRQLPEKHFGLWKGSNGWQHFTATVECQRGATWFEFVVGIYRASGKAWFTDLTFVEGNQPAEFADTVEIFEALQMAHQSQLTTSARTRPRAAILRDELPVRGAKSDPAQLAKLFAENYDVEFLSAADLANSAVLNRQRFDLLVLAYGETFPLPAAENFRAFLAEGGDLFTSGGYALRSPIVQQEGHWRYLDEILPPQNSPSLLKPIQSGSFWKSSSGSSASISEVELPDESKSNALHLEIADHLFHHSAEWSAEVDATQEADQYLFHCWLRYESIVPAPDGSIKLTIEQLDEKGNYIWGDNFAPLPEGGSAPWHRLSRIFFLRYGCIKLRVHLTIESATGLVEIAQPVLQKIHAQPRLNTATGHPQDELVVASQQLGFFDADFRLRRVSELRLAPSIKDVLPAPLWKGNYTGYAATCVVGINAARWIPLLDSYDGAGRKRGAAGSLVHHHLGYYARSSWAFFGIESHDLFSAQDPNGEALLRAVSQKLQNKISLHDCESDLACYQQGEKVRLRVAASNFGRNAASCSLSLHIRPVGSSEIAFVAKKQIKISAGATHFEVIEWNAQSFAADRYEASVELRVNELLQDAITSGFNVWNASTLASGMNFEYKKNYFSVEGQNLFLAGTDDYLHTFINQDENPRTWDADAEACRDTCIDVYENLMGLRGPQQHPTRQWWRWIDAMLLNVQRAGGIFFPGLLIFNNTAVAAMDLEEQCEYAAAFARRYKDAAGIMYYLNGDLELHDPNVPEIAKLYNDYLRQKYGSDEALRTAWKLSPPESLIGNLPVKSGKDDWQDLRTLDDFVFRSQMVKRWLDPMHNAIRRQDAQHPITAEFYQVPYAGIDMLTAIGPLELANFGFFQGIDEDFYRFPQSCKFLDQRVRGKGLNIGEFGVKTHPAWADAEDWIRTRSEQYEQSYFLAISHYAFALGASKIQNWCWKYPSDLPFAWGINYSNELIGRDVRAFYRNASLFFRNLRPSFEPAEVLLLIAGENRKGGQGSVIAAAIQNAIRLLIDQRVDFHTLPDEFIDEIPAQTKTIFYPLPYCPSDAVVDRLEAFVQSGGQLYLSGDISYDTLRNRTRLNRFKRMCGVEFVQERYNQINFAEGAIPAFGKRDSWPSYAAAPGIIVRLAGAEALVADEQGNPIVTDHKLGDGRVVFSADPLELHGDARHHNYAHQFYAALCAQFSLHQNMIEPSNAPVHSFNVPSQDAREITILVDTLKHGPAQALRVSTAAGTVGLTLHARKTGAIVVDPKNGIVAVESSSDVTRNGNLLIASNLHFMAIALDDHALESSRSLLLLPMGTGSLRLPAASQWQHPVAIAGEMQSGRWHSLLELSIDAHGQVPSIAITDAVALSMILFCDEQSRKESITRIETLVNKPWKMRPLK